MTIDFHAHPVPDAFRKWLPKNKELFEKYGINVNWDNLGVWTEEQFNAVSGSNGEDGESGEQVKGDSDGSSDIRERLYKIKKGIRRIPQNIKGVFRKIHSLI